MDFHIVVISAIAEGVDVGDFKVAAGDVGTLTPCIVGVFGYNVGIFVGNPSLSVTFVMRSSLSYSYAKVLSSSFDVMYSSALRVNLHSEARTM